MTKPLCVVVRVGVVTAVLLILSTTSSVVNAAHSRRRPVVVRREVEPRYDRSITTFSSDGRLLQVEYGLEASRRGDPVFAMLCNANNDTGASSQVCMIAVHSSDKVYRIDDHIVMVTAGLVGDANMMASTLRSQCRRFRMLMGEPPTLQEAARMAADLQHALTRNPGLRPLGCTAILAGVDDIGSRRVLKLFSTDPGGILEECRYCAAGKGQDMAMRGLHALSEDVVHRLTQENENRDNRIQLIKGVAEVALDALQKQSKERSEEHVDVWMLQCDKRRRGGVHLKCLQKIRRQDLSMLKERLAPIDL